MFSVHCPTHGARVLLPEERIEALTSASGRHRVRWRCWCGTRGTTVLSRANAPQLRPPVV